LAVSGLTMGILRSQWLSDHTWSTYRNQ